MPSSRGQVSSGPRRARDLDAVTIDAFGTLVVLDDPAGRLRAALAGHGVDRSDAEVAEAFRAEAAYYRPRSLRGRDAASLAALQAECVGVFLMHARAGLDAETFVPAFVDAIRFRAADGAREAVATLRAAGLELACVANWDVSLRGHLERLGLDGWFREILSSAEAGAEKPDPAIFRLALSRLGVSPARALHIGDDQVDEDGARAAGLAFEPVPLATLPERLGLR